MTYPIILTFYNYLSVSKTFCINAVPKEKPIIFIFLLGNNFSIIYPKIFPVMIALFWAYKKLLLHEKGYYCTFKQHLSMIPIYLIFL